MKEDIKVIIIDDEKLARDIIRENLNRFPEFNIISECSNGFEALKAINENSPDLIFLDIQMPKITGFELLELLEKPPVIIFSTAFDQYALKAFEVNATDYLMKPFSEERFNDAVKKAKIALQNKENVENNLNSLISHNDENTESINRIVVKKGTKISILSLDKISHLEAQDDYVMLYTTEGKFLKQKTMKYFEDHLPAENFIRVHRSYIFNLDFMKQIELYEKDTRKVILKDGTALPVSKTGYQRLKEIMEK